MSHAPVYSEILDLCERSSCYLATSGWSLACFTATIQKHRYLFQHHKPLPVTWTPTQKDWLIELGHSITWCRYHFLTQSTFVKRISHISGKYAILHHSSILATDQWGDFLWFNNNWFSEFAQMIRRSGGLSIYPPQQMFSASELFTRQRRRIGDKTLACVCLQSACKLCKPANKQTVVKLRARD